MFGAFLRADLESRSLHGDGGKTLSVSEGLQAQLGEQSDATLHPVGSQQRWWRRRRLGSCRTHWDDDDGGDAGDVDDGGDGDGDDGDGTDEAGDGCNSGDDDSVNGDGYGDEYQGDDDENGES